MIKQVVTETEKRSVTCPECCRPAGKPCVSSRIPGPSTFGGGWGGPPDLDRAHNERRLQVIAHRDAAAWIHAKETGERPADHATGCVCPVCEVSSKKGGV